MTRLICTEDGSSKFWEGSVEGKSLTVRFGKIGTDGQTKTKSFGNSADAEKELAKLVKEKRAKGYVDEAGASPSPRTPASTKGFEQALAKLDPLLKEKRPAVAASLRPGLDPAKALKKVLAGKAVPADLVAWFGWHDGQSPTCSFSGEDNYFLHTVDAAVDAWTFLNDPTEDIAKPPKPSWLPLFENGAGDHRVYDLESGAIVAYFHDDDDRPRIFPSLMAWATAIRAELEKAPAPPKGQKVSVDEAKWEPVKTRPKEAAVQGFPIGTAFIYGWQAPTGKQVTKVYVKTGPGVWLSARGLPQLEERLGAPPAKDYGCWHRDWDVWYSLDQTKKTSNLRRAVLPLSG